MSPLKHYTGSVRPALAAWRCPTCRAENTGPLEAGCTSCGAGGDAKKVPLPPAPSAPARSLTSLLEAPPMAPPPPALAADAGRASPELQAAFEQWLRDVGGVPTDVEATVAVAFLAGATWGQAHPQKTYQPREYAVPVTDGLSTTVGEALMQTPTAKATIAAALRFYAGNTLAYGYVPGQLSAEDTLALADLFDGGVTTDDTEPTAPSPEPDAPGVPDPGSLAGPDARQ